jgi:hypothetical protein
MEVLDIAAGDVAMMAPHGQEEENPFLKNNDEDAVAEAKKKTSRFKITAEDLTDGPRGLN